MIPQFKDALRTFLKRYCCALTPVDYMIECLEAAIIDLKEWQKELDEAKL